MPLEVGGSERGEVIGGRSKKRSPERNFDASRKCFYKYFTVMDLCYLTFFFYCGGNAYQNTIIKVSISEDINRQFGTMAYIRGRDGSKQPCQCHTPPPPLLPFFLPSL